MSTYQPGDTVWTEDGRKASYVSKVGSEHAVRFAYRPRGEDDEEEYFGSRIETVGRVFATAPIEVIDAEIVKRQSKLDDLTARALEKHRELTTLEREQKDRMAHLQQHEELRQLEAWLAGKITHFVTAGGHCPRIRVLDWDTALETTSEWSGSRTGTAVLALKVGWDKKLAWTKTERPQYDHLRPHTSLEDARADAANLIAKMISTWNNRVDVARTRHLIADATALGLLIPQEMTDSVRNYDILVAEGEAKKKRAELDLAMAKLAKVRETTDA